MVSTERITCQGSPGHQRVACLVPLGRRTDFMYQEYERLSRLRVAELETTSELLLYSGSYLLSIGYEGYQY